MNFVKFLGTPFLQNISGRLLLNGSVRVFIYFIDLNALQTHHVYSMLQNVETVVSTSFQRGMFVGKTIRPKISFQTFSISLPNLLILPVPICTIVSQAHEIIFFF